MFEGKLHPYLAFINALNNRRQEQIHQLAVERNSACVFVAAYDAMHAFYPERLLPSAKDFWREIHSKFPFATVYEGRVGPEYFFDTALTTYAELGIQVTEIHLLEGLKRLKSGSIAASLVPTFIHDPSEHYNIKSSPYSLLLDFPNSSDASTHLHMLTDDQSPRAKNELQELFHDGWEVGAVFELSKKER